MAIRESGSFKVGGSRATYVLVICSLLNAVAYADWQVMSVVLQPMITLRPKHGMRMTLERR